MQQQPWKLQLLPSCLWAGPPTSVFKVQVRMVHGFVAVASTSLWSLESCSCEHNHCVGILDTFLPCALSQKWRHTPKIVSKFSVQRSKLGFHQPQLPVSITYKISEWNLKASIQPVWKSTWIIPQLPHPEISTASENLNFCHPWRNVAPVNQRLEKKWNPHQVMLVVYTHLSHDLIHPFNGAGFECHQ